MLVIAEDKNIKYVVQDIAINGSLASQIQIP